MALLTDPERLAAIDRTGLLDQPPAAAFERASRLAAALLDVPIAHTTLVLDDRQWYPGQVGLPAEVAEAQGTPISYSFCRHVVELGEPFVVADTSKEPRLVGNQAVEQFQVAAYIGVPLEDEAGLLVGTVCGLDFTERTWTDDQVARLTDLATMLRTDLVLRAELGRLREARDRALASGLLVSQFRVVGRSLVPAIDEIPPAARSEELDRGARGLRDALTVGDRLMGAA